MAQKKKDKTPPLRTDFNPIPPWGDSPIKRPGVLVGNLEKQKPLEVPILKQNITSCHICSVQYPLRYHKRSRCGPFGAEHPQRYPNRHFN